VCRVLIHAQVNTANQHRHTCHLSTHDNNVIMASL